MNVRLLYDCVADHETQLSGKAGDIVVNCVSDPNVPGWLFGRLLDKSGWIPENYCQEIKVAQVDPQQDRIEKERAAAEAERLAREQAAAEAVEAQRRAEEARRLAEEEAERERQRAEEERLREEEEQRLLEEEAERERIREEEEQRFLEEEAERLREEEEQRLLAEEAERERLREEEEQRLLQEEAERTRLRDLAEQERLGALEAERAMLAQQQAAQEALLGQQADEARRREAEAQAAAEKERADALARQQAEAEAERKRAEEEQRLFQQQQDELARKKEEEERAKQEKDEAERKRIAASSGAAARGRGRARARGGRGEVPVRGGGGSQVSKARGALMRRLSESGAAPRGGAAARGRGQRPSVGGGRGALASKLGGGIASQLNRQLGGGAVPKPKVAAPKKVTVYKGLFKFDRTADNQLSFNAGDIIKNVVVTDTGWSSGQIGQASGWFPSNYVEKVEMTEDELANLGPKQDIGIEAPEEGLAEDVAPRVGDVAVLVSVPDIVEKRTIAMKYEQTFGELIAELRGKVGMRLQDLGAYGLYVMPADVTQPACFVVPENPLSTFDLLEDSLEFTKRERVYKVILPDKSRTSVTADCNMKVSDALEHLRKTTSFKSIDYQLHTASGVHLDNTRKLWGLDIPEYQLHVKMPLFKLTVFVKGHKEETIEVDYTRRVHDVLKQFCEDQNIKFGQDLFLTQLGGSAAQLKPSSSLEDQRVFHPATVLLKSKTGSVVKVALEDKQGAPDEADDLSADDVNIYDEPRDHTTVRMSEKVQAAGEPKQIQAATLNKLIEHLTGAESHDMKFTRAFLLTYLSFTTPRILLHKLIQRYTVPDSHAAKKKAIQLRVVNVLRMWIEASYDDFDHDLTEELVEFIDSRLVPDKFSSLAAKLRQGILQRTCAMKGSGGQKLVFGKRAPMPKIGKEIATFTSWLDFDEEEICRQITVVDFNMYTAVKPSEFLNQSWNKPKLRHKAVQLLETIQRVNKMGMFVAHQIIEPDKPKLRAKRWTKLIRIAYQLRMYNNFNGLMAFIGGMNNSALSRMKQTRALMSKRNLDIMEELADVMSTTGSYKNFRAILHKLDPPCIPYIGVYLRDLTFIEDGNPDLQDGLINFEKRKMLFKTISEIQLYQQSRYNLEPVQIIAKFLNPLPGDITDAKLYDMSLEREPKTKR